MANWKCSINIADLFDEDDSREAAVQAAQRLKQRLSAQVPPSLRDEEFDGLMNDLDTVPNCEEFNFVLDQFYSWGDVRHRLFLNTFPEVPNAQT